MQRHGGIEAAADGGTGHTDLDAVADERGLGRIRELECLGLGLVGQLTEGGNDGLRRQDLRVLAAQMGVGGDDSWMSPVHSQYHIPADQPISLDVNLELI